MSCGCDYALLLKTKNEIFIAYATKKPFGAFADATNKPFGAFADATNKPFGAFADAINKPFGAFADAFYGEIPLFLVEKYVFHNFF